jgi:hypothetical protein
MLGFDRSMCVYAVLLFLIIERYQYPLRMEDLSEILSERSYRRKFITAEEASMWCKVKSDISRSGPRPCSHEVQIADQF